MGGYDLYSSKWNEDTKDWDVPVNMGFPYSSPFDDFLFINTPDGKYSIFASNRGCPSDSVDVYVVEYDGMPVRKAVTEREDLIALAALSPDGDPYSRCAGLTCSRVTYSGATGEAAAICSATSCSTSFTVSLTSGTSALTSTPTLPPMWM